MEYYSQAKLSLPQTEYNLYNNLGNTFNDLSDYGQGLVFHKKAEDIALANGRADLLAQSSNNIAISCIGLKRYEEVLPRVKKAKQYYQKSKNWELLVRVMRTEGLLYERTKDYKKGFTVMCSLDDVQRKLISQIKTDFTAHGGKLLDAFWDDTKVLQTQYELAKQELNRQLPGTFIGISTASSKVVDSAILASQYPDTCVFIEGESGTGKEIVAQMIHNHSIRSDQPYVTVNCASISPNLFESEFFGHVRGSFTGANQDKKGFFQLANNGTLFLDEISEMPMEFQAKLLRAIDTKKIIPVGKGTEQKINCKIISATNLNIHKLIVEGRFRLDLFHRVNAIEIYIPPLRERPDDIPELLDFFVQRFAGETNKPKPQITGEFLSRLQGYPFPGNVRELKNIVERIFILFYKPVWDGDLLDNFSTFYKQALPVLLHKGLDIKSIEREMIQAALIKCKGKQVEAAKLLNLTESTLSRKIKRLQINK